MNVEWKICKSEFTAWANGTTDTPAYDGPKFHAVLCDPPYGIAFMGRAWDDPGGPEAFQKQGKEWGEALLKVLYPGALVFMFGGTRMWHRLAAGMEDAGFFLWDTLMWIHGMGFPKAQGIDVLIDKHFGNERPVIGTRTDGCGNTENSEHKAEGFASAREAVYQVTGPASIDAFAWQGHKTPQLKPAWEPILAFRAPDEGLTHAEMALKYGTSALNIAAARIGNDEAGWGGGGREEATCYGWGGGARPNGEPRPVIGRYPPNVVLECTCTELTAVDAAVPVPGVAEDRENSKTTCYGEYKGRVTAATVDGIEFQHTDPNCPAFQLDKQAGEVGGPSTGGYDFGKSSADNPVHLFTAIKSGVHYGDAGGPSRFFYCAKASREEREKGLDCYDDKLKSWAYAVPEDNGYVPPAAKNGVRNHHPTVKPITLNTWLAKLLLPAETASPRRVLVPFSGVGSEMVGAALAGWDEVYGVEMNPEYVIIAGHRMRHHADHDGLITIDGKQEDIKISYKRDASKNTTLEGL